MRIKKLWTFPSVILLGLITVSLWVNFKHNTTSCPNRPVEVWAHRGEHAELPENSKAAVDQAYYGGFTGVEIDVFYDEEYGLVVSHDHPYIQVDGEVVLIQDVIYGYDDEFRFWLDVKNLSIGNLKRAKKALYAAFEKEAGLKERCFIESGNGRALRRLNADFNCIYWLQYGRIGWRGTLKRWSIKFLMSVTDFDGITTDHRYIDEGFKRHFNNKCWYVFTVNSEEHLNELREMPEVQVVLTDLTSEQMKQTNK